jgi:DNA repair exonuclease SbcCD ATPase subunit
VPLQTIDLSNSARMLIAEPGTAAQIRIQLIQSRPVVSDAVIGMVALSRLLANEVNRRFKDVLEEIKREQAKTRALIEELERKIEQLEHEKKQELESLQKKKEELLHQIGRIKAQAEKLKRMAEKIQEILPRLNELLAADTKSTPTRACVSARIAKVRQIQSDLESSVDELTEPKYRAPIYWFRRLLDHVPVLFDIPGWR